VPRDRARHAGLRRPTATSASPCAGGEVISLTMNTYTHVLPARRVDAAKTMNAILGGDEDHIARRTGDGNTSIGTRR